MILFQINQPFPDMIFIAVLAIIMILLGVALTRWALRINHTIDVLEKQLRATEETITQNERIIKLLSADNDKSTS